MKKSKMWLFLLLVGSAIVLPGCCDPNATFGSQAVALRPQGDQ